jgi:predicted nucleotide-binding protein with TIR-like domain
MIGDEHQAAILSAIALANSEQDEFVFCSADEDFVLRARMHAFSELDVGELFDRIESLIADLRGYHPFVIAIVDSSLYSVRFLNLFGSHRAEQGLAAVTTSQVPDVIMPADRLVGYFVYYLARYSLNFLSPHHRTHDDSRGCVFDRKINKMDIIASMRAGALCDECRRSLVSGAAMLSSRQFAALDKLFALTGRIMRDGLERDGRPRIFVGSSSEGLPVANKIQELLADEFSVVVWDQGTVFGLGDATLEALEAAVLAYQSGIFVFTADDRIEIRGQILSVARDNVIFELGMFIGKLGRRRAFVVHPAQPEITLPSDLNGITTASYPPGERDLAVALAGPVNRIRAAVRQLIR